MRAVLSWWGAGAVNLFEIGAAIMSECREAGWRRSPAHTAAAIVVVAAAAFLVLLVLVLARWRPLLDLDTRTVADLNRFASTRPSLTGLVQTVSDLGDRPAVWTVAAFATISLLLLRRTRSAVFIGVACVGALGLELALKATVGRVRPAVEVPLSVATGESFPSGHALGTVATYGALVLVGAGWLRPWLRALVLPPVVLVVVAIGLTRPFLGVHFVTDVVAGWALGVAWLGGVWLMIMRPGVSRR